MRRRLRVLLAVCSTLLLAWVVVTPLAQSPQTGSADALMGAAQHLQDVEANYLEAIAGYRKVLALPGVSRALAARAQLLIGVCYERLGKTEAKTAYQAVISGFSDQKDIVGEARQRLQAFTPAGARAVITTLKQIPIAVQADMAGPPSPDGRYSLVREDRTGDVFIQDLRTGEVRRLTHGGSGLRADPVPSRAPRSVERRAHKQARMVPGRAFPGVLLRKCPTAGRA